MESNKIYRQRCPNNKSPNSPFSFSFAILFSFTNIIPLTLCNIKPINNETIGDGTVRRGIHYDHRASKTNEDNHLVNDATDIHRDLTPKQLYVTKYSTN